MHTFELSIPSKKILDEKSFPESLFIDSTRILVFTLFISRRRENWKILS